MRLRAALERMQAAQRHRGPDDQGVWVSETGQVGFAHNRLAILDLSVAGRQPMTTADGRFTITFNGEIYNYRELRAELEAVGESFRTQTDTEVILAMYRRHGAACVRELAGMFAFAIWDAREQTAFLARDPLGIKPLCLHRNVQGQLVFASEMRALMASDLVERRVSARAMQGYLLYGSVPEPLSLIEGVERVPAGHHVTWRAGEVTQRHYWEVAFLAEPMSDSAAVAQARMALEESVARHFVSDVPVGIFLSGGLDSTTLLALAAREKTRELRTFCISFEDAEYDEGALAARSAAHFGAQHADWRMTAEDGRTLLRQFIGACDHPSVDGFNTYCVAKHAHDRGMKVVLSGLGGDEMFAGYPTFDLVPRLVAGGQFAAWGGPLSRALGRMLEGSGPSPRLRRVGAFLGGAPSTAAAYWCARGIFTPREVAALVRHYTDVDATGVAEDMHFVVPPQPTLADEISWLELSRYMRNQLLRDSDVLSMAWGLELRVPFVDSRLLESVGRIPARQRLVGGKQLMRAAVPELPAWVLEQPKRGFRFPFDRWMETEWSGVFEAVERRSPIRLQSWYRRWCVMALEAALHKLGVKPVNLLLNEQSGLW